MRFTFLIPAAASVVALSAPALAQDATPAEQLANEPPPAATTTLTPDQQAAIRSVANDLHRLNHAVMKAVEAGVSVELVRSARHHGGAGNWGDLLIPVIVTQSRG